MQLIGFLNTSAERDRSPHNRPFNAWLSFRCGVARVQRVSTWKDR